MALNLGSIFCMLGADTSGLNSAERQMTRFAKNTQKHFSDVESAATRFKQVLGTIISVQAAKGLVMLADEYKGITARIRQSTVATKDFYAVQQRLEEISSRVGADFYSQVKLFQNVSRAAPEVGATNKEVVRLTESLAKLAVISGASPEAMKFAMLQFGQAMASGIVRAEEFNSIVENTPEVAVRIAHGLGMSVGHLRTMVKDGKMLASEVFKSLLSESANIDESFSQMPRRIGQAMASLKLGAMKFLGNLDQSLGVTGGITSAIQGIADFLNSDMSNAFMNLDLWLAGMGDSWGQWKIHLGSINDELNRMTGWGNTFGDKMILTIGYIGESLIKAPQNFKLHWDLASAAVTEAMISIEALVRNIGNSFQIVWELVKIGAYTAAAAVAEYFGKAMVGVMGLLRDAMGGMASLADYIPGLDGMASTMRDWSAGMDGAGDSSQKLADDLRGLAGESEARLNDLAKEGNAIRELSKLEEEANDEAWNAAQDAYEQQDQIFRDNKEKREKDFLDAKAKLDAIRKAQEDAYNNAKAGAPTTGVANLKGAGGGSGGAKGQKGILAHAMAELDQYQRVLGNRFQLEQEWYDKGLAALKAAEDLKIASIMPYHQLRERLEEEHQKRIRQIIADGSEDTKKIRGLNALLGVKLTQKAGDMEIEEQAKVFGSLIDGASQYSREFFELKKALAIATALVDGPKSILASYAFGTELGGPVVGAAFAAIAGAAVGAMIAGISSAQFTASKATGGNVFAGGMYKVNEQGPELFSSGGSDYLMMGSKGGHITPNSQLGGGGGGNVTVVVNNNTDATATTRESQGPDGKIIEILIQRIKHDIAGDIAMGRGAVPSAIQKTYRLGRGHTA